MPNETEKRERGSGSIFKNGSAVWWVKFYVRGIPKRESSHSTDYEAAKKLLRRRLAEVETRTFVMRTNVKVDELIDDMVAEYKRERRKSLSFLEMRWKNHLEPFLGRMKVDDINTDTVQRYSKKREDEGASGPCINRELSVLKRAYHLAMQCTPPKVRACPVIPFYKESDARQGFLTDDEYTRLARECNKVGLWLRAMLTTAYTFAFRKGELLGLRVRQVDLISRTIRLDVGSTKNGEGRIAPMTDEVVTLLTACIIGKKPDDRVFTREDGKPVGDFRKKWASVCKRAGVDGLLFHDLRRSGVRNMRRLGIQESIAMKISGHKTRSVFERYNIVDESDITEAGRKLNEKQKSNAPLEIPFGQGLGIVAPKTVHSDHLQPVPLPAPLPN